MIKIVDLQSTYGSLILPGSTAAIAQVVERGTCNALIGGRLRSGPISLAVA